MTATRITRSEATLEELVDRLIDAVFGEQPTTPAVASGTGPSLARTIHDARRLARAGNLDAALGRFTELDRSAATDCDLGWAYTEFLQLARRRFAAEEALLYRPASGRAAIMTPHREGLLEVRAVLGLRWRAGKVVSRRSLRGLRRLGNGGPS